jgi:RNA polymerase sigma-70 factor (ECF subfamily)
LARESKLLAGVAHGDESSFRRLYDEYSTRIFRYALTLLRNAHLAEEVTQETMIAIWKNASTYSGKSQVSTWILGIARNKAFGILRNEDKGKRLPRHIAFVDDPAPIIEQKERVLAALDRLPADQREIVFLTFYENLSYKAIAGLLQIPEGTVKSRMYYAKRKLEEALS